MTKDELLKRLAEYSENFDAKEAHICGDEALIAYINDQDIAEAYGKIRKVYGARSARGEPAVVS